MYNSLIYSVIRYAFWFFGNVTTSIGLTLGNDCRPVSESCTLLMVSTNHNKDLIFLPREVQRHA